MTQLQSVAAPTDMVGLEEAYLQDLAQAVPRLRRIALGATADRANGDALVAEACRAALRIAPPHRPADALATMLTTDLARRASEPNDLPASRAAFPDLSVIPAAMRDDVDGVCSRFAALTTEQRLAVTLVCVDAKSYREAAGILTVPEAEFFAALVEARRALVGGDTGLSGTAIADVIRFVDQALTDPDSAAHIKQDDALAHAAAVHRRAVTALRAAINAPMHEPLPADIRALFDARRADTADQAARARERLRRRATTRRALKWLAAAALPAAGLIGVLLIGVH